MNSNMEARLNGLREQLAAAKTALEAYKYDAIHAGLRVKRAQETVEQINGWIRAIDVEGLA